MSARLQPERLTFPEMAEMLAPHAGEIAQHILGTPPTSRSGTEWRFRDSGSLRVYVGGSKRGGWCDFKDSDARGDALALVKHLAGGTMAEAYRWGLSWLGVAEGGGHPRPPDMPRRPPQPAPKPSAEPASADLARRLWQEAGPASGSLVPVYLASRGLTLPDDAPLRFHPAAWRNRTNGPTGPAMLAAMTDPATAEPLGVHVTYLRPDGSGKAEGPGAKIKLGRAGVVRLVPDEEVTEGLGLAEGIETALATMQHFQWAPVWAAGDAGSIGSFPVLNGIEELTIFADSDDSGTGLEAAQKCAARWAKAGRLARINAAPTGTDFADLARRAA